MLRRRGAAVVERHERVVLPPRQFALGLPREHGGGRTSQTTSNPRSFETSQNTHPETRYPVSTCVSASGVVLRGRRHGVKRLKNETSISEERRHV